MSAHSPVHSPILLHFPTCTLVHLGLASQRRAASWMAKKEAPSLVLSLSALLRNRQMEIWMRRDKHPRIVSSIQECPEMACPR